MRFLFALFCLVASAAAAAAPVVYATATEASKDGCWSYSSCGRCVTSSALVNLGIGKMPWGKKCKYYTIIGTNQKYCVSVNADVSGFIKPDYANYGAASTKAECAAINKKIKDKTNKDTPAEVLKAVMDLADREAELEKAWVAAQEKKDCAGGRKVIRQMQERLNDGRAPGSTFEVGFEKMDKYMAVYDVSDPILANLESLAENLAEASGGVEQAMSAGAQAGVGATFSIFEYVVSQLIAKYAQKNLADALDAHNFYGNLPLFCKPIKCIADPKATSSYVFKGMDGNDKGSAMVCPACDLLQSEITRMAWMKPYATKVISLCDHLINNAETVASNINAILDLMIAFKDARNGEQAKTEAALKAKLNALATAIKKPDFAMPPPAPLVSQLNKRKFKRTH